MKRGRNSANATPNASGVEGSDFSQILQDEIDAIIKNWKTHKVAEEHVLAVIRASREIIMAEPMLVEVEAPVTICGDLHGQIFDLVSIFSTCGTPEQRRYLFLGDYVDRGKHSVETLIVLLSYKILYPDQIFMLRGNHETPSINQIYGFHDECKRKYSSQKVYKTFGNLFNCFPVAAVVESRVLCMHGGLSPELTNIAQIREATRPAMITDKGMLCDLLWSDPEEGISGWGKSERGVSCTFGADVVRAFLDSNDLDLVCRAHQVMEKGYEFFGGRQLVTVFSATNYCGEFTNCGAALMIDSDLKCAFQVFRPHNHGMVPKF